MTTYILPSLHYIFAKLQSKNSRCVDGVRVKNIRTNSELHTDSFPVFFFFFWKQDQHFQSPSLFWLSTRCFCTNRRSLIITRSLQVVMDLFFWNAVFHICCSVSWPNVPAVLQSHYFPVINEAISKDIM